MKSNSEALELMRAIIHNKVLLMVILSKLGMEDDEIDKLCKDIYDALDKDLDNFLNGEKNEEEDKDIPLIPDDELIILKQSKTVDMQYAIDFNFRVVEEKINQVVEEFNEYRKENEENEKQKEKK